MKTFTIQTSIHSIEDAYPSDCSLNILKLLFNQKLLCLQNKQQFQCISYMIGLYINPSLSQVQFARWHMPLWGIFQFGSESIIGRFITSTFVTKVAPASCAALAMAIDTDPIPPSTYLPIATNFLSIWADIHQKSMWISTGRSLSNAHCSFLTQVQTKSTVKETTREFDNRRLLSAKHSWWITAIWC